MELKNKQKKANIVGCVAVSFLALYLIIFVGLGVLTDKGAELPSSLVLVLSELVFIIPVIGYMLFTKASIKDDLGFKKIKISTVALGVLYGYAVSCIASFINILSQFFVENTMTQSSDALLGESPIFALIIASIIAPICEEVAFRGVIFNSQKKVSTPVKACVVSALCFGLMHLNINQCSYAFVLGFLFALLNLASGSILTSIIAHITINASNMLLMLAASFVLKTQGQNIAETTEAARQDMRTMVIMAVVYGFSALVALLIAFLLLREIAKIEGHQDELNQIFKKKENAETQTEANIEASDVKEENARIFLNIPMLVYVVVCVVWIIIFELGLL